MDWFEALTGFKEKDYRTVKECLYLDGEELCSKVNSRRYSVGAFKCLSLNELRKAASDQLNRSKRSSVEIIKADVTDLLNSNDNGGCIFQVASQFNCLEMVGPKVSPEDGVTRYQFDKTQGPACSVAAGAATIFRNYFVPINGQSGQTSALQINTLSEFSKVLARDMHADFSDLWKMENGYLIGDKSSLTRINAHLDECDGSDLDRYRGYLQVGTHWDIQVTSSSEIPQPIVSQVFCSAIPVSYNNLGSSRSEEVRLWSQLSRLVLQAAYEATLMTPFVRTDKNNKEPSVFLTLLGGGAFGNQESWILGSIKRALNIVKNSGLNIKIVCFSEPSEELVNLVSDFSRFR